MKIIQVIIICIVFSVQISHQSSNSTSDCIKCILNRSSFWCPDKNDLTHGNCFSSENSNSTTLAKSEQKYCSSKMDQANEQIKLELKMFSCPFKEYCGTNDLQTIVPTYDGAVRQFVKTTKFGSTGLCRHRVKFPMDATWGDKILLNVNKLQSNRLSLALGREFDSSGALNEYLFTPKVNNRGGFIRYPYPYEAYIVVTQENHLSGRSGSFSFDVRLVKGSREDQELALKDLNNENPQIDTWQKVKYIYEYSNEIVLKEVEHEDADYFIHIVSICSFLLLLFILAVVYCICDQLKANAKKLDQVEQLGQDQKRQPKDQIHLSKIQIQAITRTTVDLKPKQRPDFIEVENEAQKNEIIQSIKLFYEKKDLDGDQIEEQKEPEPDEELDDLEDLGMGDHSAANFDIYDPSRAQSMRDTKREGEALFLVQQQLPLGAKYSVLPLANKYPKLI